MSLCPYAYDSLYNLIALPVGTSWLVGGIKTVFLIIGTELLIAHYCSDLFAS